MRRASILAGLDRTLFEFNSDVPAGGTDVVIGQIDVIDISPNLAEIWNLTVRIENTGSGAMTDLKMRAKFDGANLSDQGIFPGASPAYSLAAGVTDRDGTGTENLELGQIVPIVVLASSSAGTTCVVKFMFPW